MKQFIYAGALLLVASTAHAAETIKATVGHMCCGGCKAAATAGLKSLAWAENITIEDTTVTVTAKEGQQADAISLMEALSKAGFPAASIMTSEPITLTINHLCCGGCVNDLKTKLADFNSRLLDKEKVKIDQAAKTVTLQPVAGQSMNVVAVLNQLQRRGFSASKCVMSPAASAGKSDGKKAARR